MSGIFYNIEPKVINTELACLIGLNEAIVLQQFHYWIEKNKATGTNLHDGFCWTYGTIQEYRDRDFKFWSFNTVKRTITKLISMGLIIKGNFNKLKMDHTNWYAIDYAAVDELVRKNTPAKIQHTNVSDCPNRSAQDGLIEQPEMSHSNSPRWANRTAQIEPSEQPNMTHAIQENKKEINNNGLENKTNTQKAASPTASGACEPRTVPDGVADVEVVYPVELLFDEFWKLYPRKESKQQAKKAWMKLNPGQELFTLIANALEYRRQTKEWLAEGGRYIPHPATWLNGRRWEDELDPDKFCQSAILQEQYGDIFVDGKPLDPVQRKQLEYIQRQMNQGVNHGGVQ